MKESISIRKYVEIYDHMKLSELAKLLNITETELVANIGNNNPSFEDLICIVQLFDSIPICFKTLNLLKITIESISNNDIYNPCISIMGHINHGKSSVVEALISQDICSKEAGHITQNISLYNFKKDKTSFILIDTPGHAALDNMRNIVIPLSEIIIIIVAANSGPQEQTFKIIENTNHKDRILCLNKIDANNLINEEYIYEKCASYGLACNELNENNGVPVVKISAKNNINMNGLIDEISSMIELKQYKTDLKRPAVGYIIDAFVIVGRGRIIRILLKAGICTIGDSFCLNGSVYTMNRIFINGDKPCKKDEYIQAGCFIDVVCEAKCQMGDLFFVSNDKNHQNQICKLQINEIESKEKGEDKRQFIIYIQNIQQHNLLKNILPKNSIVKVYMNNNILKEDIMLCKENNISIIIWYKINNITQDLLIANEINYIASPTLLIGDIDEFIKIEVKKEIKEEVIGSGIVKAVFYMKKDIILGNDVKSGKIVLGKKCIVKRNNEEICRGVIRSLEHNREHIEEAKSGLECGLIIKDIVYIKKEEQEDSKKFEFMIGDVIEVLK